MCYICATKLKTKKMIKKLFSFALLAGFISVNAQQIKIASPKANVYTNTNSIVRLGGNNQVQNLIDTLTPISLTYTCATQMGGLVYYSVDQVAPMDSGYYFGTGIFPFAGATTTEISQKYPSGAAGLTVTNVLVLAAKANGGLNSSTSAKIYSENTSTKAPNTVLGTSTPMTMSTFTTGAYNNYVFGSPVAVAANLNFHCAITIPGFGGPDLDTMAVISTQLGCSSTDSLSWMNVSPYGWFNVKALFGGNLDLLIFPVVDIPTVGVTATKGNLSLYSASPNPASNSININFSLSNASKVEIEVIDLTGKIVKTIKGNNTFQNGKNTITIDVQNLESGSYFYSVNASGSRIFSKFVVTK